MTRVSKKEPFSSYACRQRRIKENETDRTGKMGQNRLIAEKIIESAHKMMKKNKIGRAKREST